MMKQRFRLYPTLVAALTMAAAWSTGCGRDSATAPQAPELLAHPEAAPPATVNETPPVVTDWGHRIEIAAAVAPPDTMPTHVHLTTWPYKTTNLTHETKTTLYRDDNHKRWIHLVTWPLDTSYIPYPDPLPTGSKPAPGTDIEMALPVN